jgi:hypothetical protein
MELTEIIQPHVLRTVLRLQSAHGERVTEAQVLATGLTEKERMALVQTKRLVEEEPGVYRINPDGR